MGLTAIPAGQTLDDLVRPKGLEPLTLRSVVRSGFLVPSMFGSTRNPSGRLHLVCISPAESPQVLALHK